MYLVCVFYAIKMHIQKHFGQQQQQQQDEWNRNLQRILKGKDRDTQNTR